jgi:hypothetical protein
MLPDERNYWCSPSRKEKADMDLIGYHGTSEISARNILDVGINERFLPPTGQIGRGFYIAKMNGALPQWAAGWATAGARANLRLWVRMISFLTGDVNNPFVDDHAQRTILKIYAVRPLCAAGGTS